MDDDEIVNSDFILKPTFEDFWHDANNAISEISKLSSFTENQANNAEVLSQKLRAINGRMLALSAKNSFLKYLSAQDGSEITYYKSEFSKAIDRTCYSAKHINAAYKKRCTVTKSLLCHSEYEGPYFFDFIPFSILENAVKYNIQNRDVTVRTFTEKQSCVAEFSSWGPKIEDSELERIFHSTVRGTNALKSGNFGGGLGLYHSRSAVRDYFKGDITVERDPRGEFSLNNVPFSRHTFSIKIPVA